MPTEIEMFNELLNLIPDEHKLLCQKELDLFSKQENTDGKPMIHIVYNWHKQGIKKSENIINSWSLYYLNITSKQPDGPFKPKQRSFSRPTPPDVDIDFDFERRQEVFDYLISKYGENYAAHIGTYGALKMKSALTRTIKALDIADAFNKGKNYYTSENAMKVREIVDALPDQYGALLKVKDRNGEEVVIKTIEDASTTDSKDLEAFQFYIKKYPDIRKHTQYLEGLLCQYGVHASGICISDIPLNEIAPLRTGKLEDSDNEKCLSTQFSLEDLDKLGLIKFDILGLRTLTIISETKKLIKENIGIDLDITNLPINDDKVFKLYRDGNLACVFQCESPGMIDTCINMKVDSLRDIMAAISLYRPGPMDSIDAYCDIKNGRKKPSYFHPSIEPHVKPILEKTHSLLIYQEQIMQICQALAGFSIADGYMVIKGIGKKQKHIIDKYRSLFINGCFETHNIDKNIATQYWDQFITPFALYGFNLSHAGAYSLNSYTTAYLKVYYPEEFMCAYLNVLTRCRKYDKIGPVEAECERMGIKLLQRDINKSDLEYKIIKKKNETEGVFASEIRPSIFCKGLTHNAATEIVNNRPFSSIKELVMKTNPGELDADSFGCLCDAKVIKTKKDKALEEFNTLREDVKVLKRKGIPDIDMFG
jgi:DNA polymerase III subunit alpha